jgi:hypothetical protein
LRKTEAQNVSVKQESGEEERREEFEQLDI